MCRDTCDRALSFASEQNTLGTIALEFTITIILTPHLVAPALLMFGFKKSQKAKRNFASQTPLKKAKFEEFGLKKANMATLVQLH